MLDLIVFIGRFQPFHDAHLQILREAAAQARKVLIIIGSAEQPRTIKNPWNVAERIEFIRTSAIPLGIVDQLIFESNVDTKYDHQGWAARVQTLVAKHTFPGAKIGHIGHKKESDDTTFYLDMFPQWTFVNHEKQEPLDASQIRTVYFNFNNRMEYLLEILPDTVYRELKEWRKTEEALQLSHEQAFVQNYMSKYANLPYPPIFVTVDSVVIQSGHVLVIRRKHNPGKGLLALPGGFLNVNEKIEDAAIRELREETGIKVPAPVLRGNIKKVKVFDAPDRSLCGRRVTHAHKIVLPDGKLPRVKGGDDADKAFWMPLSVVKSSEFFDDHYDIIKNFEQTGV